MSQIIGLERCRMQLRPDLALRAVELTVIAAAGTGTCVLAPPSAERLAMALASLAEGEQ